MLEAKQLKSGFAAVRLHYSVDPDIWPKERIGAIRAAIPGWRWMKEYEIDFSARGGQKVYDGFDPIVHVQPHVVELAECIKYRVIDHGRRNPTACLWWAEHPKTKTLFFYREYYRPDATIAEHCRRIRELDPANETRLALIDPSTHRRLDNSTTSIADEYARYGVPTVPADNNLSTGVDEVTSALLAALARWSIQTNTLHAYLASRAIVGDQLAMLAERRAIYFHPVMTNTIRELQQLMWDEYSGAETAVCEQIRNVDEHCADCVRYAVMRQHVRPDNLRSHIKKV